MNPMTNNFMRMMDQQAMRDPQVRSAMQMLQGKSQQELKTMAMNMCRERQTTPEQVLRQLGIY